MFFLSPTLFSIIEVLVVLLPALIGVAFVTVAERKTMASMQRRLGPNITGWYGLLQAFKKKSISLFPNTRNYHTTRTLHNSSNNTTNNINAMYPHRKDAINELYKDRLAPVKIFNEKLLATCFNFLDIEQRSIFLESWGDEGGIYIIQYKHDPLVYYIGRTNNFLRRLKSHIHHKNTDKFHVFANMVGWDNFNISVVETCGREQQGIRENYYLQKYLPLLNSTFMSSHSEHAIFNTLSMILKSKKPLDVTSKDKSSDSISVWAYKYLNTHIEKTFDVYSSLSKACDCIGAGRATIQKYLDTNVPYKGLLYYSKPLVEFDMAYALAKEACDTLNIDGSMRKKVWIYSVLSDQPVLVNGQPFSSREQAAKFLNTSHNAVRYYVDSLKSQGIKGYHLFNKPLTSEELANLFELSKKKPLHLKVSVWAYNAKTFELINNTPFTSMQKCAEYFNLDYRTILDKLDTELATQQNGQLLYFFTKEISCAIASKLFNSLNKAKNVKTEVWVYKKVADQYILIDEHQPFKTKLVAYSVLNISHKTIDKYIDTHTPNKEGLFFFSEKQ